MVSVPRTDGPLARRAAALLAALLALVAAFQIFWALGGTWGISEVLGRDVEGPSALLRIASGAVALFLVAAALVVLARVGLWRRRLPSSLVRWGPWALTVLLVFIGLNNLVAETSWERFAWGPLALVAAVLSALVGRSPPPTRATDRRDARCRGVEQQTGLEAEGRLR